MLKTTADIHETATIENNSSDTRKNSDATKCVPSTSKFVMVKCLQKNENGKIEVVWNKVPSRVSEW